MKKILLTGASGFIGSALHEALKKDNEVLVLDRKEVSFDNTEKLISLCKRIDVIVHFGGLTRGTVPELVEANVLNTTRLAQSAIQSGRDIHFIFASSFAIYAPSNELLTEDSATQPKSPYGKTKEWAEKMLQTMTKNTNLSVTSLRIANAYGPNVPPYAQSVIATFIDQIKNSKPVTISGDGHQRRDFVFVNDIVRAVKKSLLHTPKSEFETFNICSSTEVSLNQLVEKISALLGIPASIDRKAGEVETATYIGDYHKAKSVLGWSPRTSFEEGLQKCVLE